MINCNGAIVGEQPPKVKVDHWRTKRARPVVMGLEPRMLNWKVIHSEWELIACYRFLLRIVL